MELRDNDLWVVTLPKAGTTWMQHIISSVTEDHDGQNIKNAWKKWYFLEYEGLNKSKSDPNENFDEYSRAPKSFTECKEAPSPRYIKSHLPLSMLPQDLLSKCKVIYVARNPQDFCVSYYYHNKGFGHYSGDFESHFDHFINDHLLYSPFWEHVKEAWNLRNFPNFLLMFYEDMKSDLPKSIRKVSKFLGKSLSDEQISRLSDLLTIDNMKKVTNRKVMKDVILRKGIVGDWKNHFTNEMIVKMKEYNENGRNGSDIITPESWEL